MVLVLFIFMVASALVASEIIILLVSPVKLNGTQGIVGNNLLQDHNIDLGKIPWLLVDTFNDIIFVDTAVEVAVERTDGLMLIHETYFVDPLFEPFDEIPEAFILPLDDGL